MTDSLPDGYDDGYDDDEAHARHSDPATSHEAAESIPSIRLRVTQNAVWNVLSRYGPMTDTDLITTYHRSGETPQSDSGIRTRRSELRERGRVADTGKRAMLRSGRRSIVWAAVR